MHTSPKKVLLINHMDSEYNRSMSLGVTTALKTAWNCEVFTLFQCVNIAVIKSIVLHNQIDTIFGINVMRPRKLWSLNVNWISWVQDYFPDVKVPEVKNDDFVFFMADKNTLGFPSSVLKDNFAYLAMGISSDRQQYPNSKIVTPEHDFSIVGFIPNYERKSLKTQSLQIYTMNQVYANLERFRAISPVLKMRYRKPMGQGLERRLEVFEREAEKIAEAFFTPLKGSYDTKGLFEAVLQLHDYYFPESLMRRSINSAKLATINAIAGAEFNQSLSLGKRRAAFFAREYPRQLERIFLAKNMISVSKQTAFYGANWQLMPETKNYAYPQISEQKSFQIFKKTKVNVCNNNHGVSVHSRLLNCMASEGFVASHGSVHDTLESIGLLSSFAPGEHFGLIDAENLKGQLNYWLKNDYERKKIVKQAKKIVFAEHTWEKRGLYIKSKLS